MIWSWIINKISIPLVYQKSAGDIVERKPNILDCSKSICALYCSLLQNIGKNRGLSILWAGQEPDSWNF